MAKRKRSKTGDLDLNFSAAQLPTKEEIKLSLELINSEGQSLANFCHVLFTLNEFIYVD